MVYRILFVSVLLLATFEGLANVTYADFQSKPNQILSTNGNVVQLRRVESYDHSTKTAGVVIDAKDKFGNIVQKKTTAKINPSKFKAWSLACLRFGAGCAAAAALVTAYEVATWVWDLDTGKLVSVQSGATYSPTSDVCPGNLINISGVWHRKTNCFTVYSTYSTFETPTQTPQAAAWATAGQTVAVLGPSELTADGVTSLGKQTYYRYRRNTAPAQTPAISLSTRTEPTPEQIVETLANNPAAWQIAPGVFPDIFDSPTLSENPATDPGSEVVEDEWIGDKPKDSDLISPDAIPSMTLDVSQNFEHETWLPSSCPEPVSFDIAGSSFTMSYDTVCNGASMVKPFIVFSGMLLWLFIVFRGIQQ